MAIGTCECLDPCREEGNNIVIVFLKEVRIQITRRDKKHLHLILCKACLEMFYSSSSILAIDIWNSFQSQGETHVRLPHLESHIGIYKRGTNMSLTIVCEYGGFPVFFYIGMSIVIHWVNKAHWN